MQNLNYLRSTVKSASRTLATVIKAENRKHSTIEEWRESQLLSFLRSLSETASDIAIAFGKRRVATVAWLARNLAELSIWIEYCTTSEDNAIKFRNDSLKDVYGMAGSLEGLERLQLTLMRDNLVESAKGLFDPIEAQTEIDGVDRIFHEHVSRLGKAGKLLQGEWVTQMSQFLGVDSIQDDHLNVSDVARSIGRRELFSKQNKFLSKFAHPTAFFIHLRPPLQNEFLSMLLNDATIQCRNCLFLMTKAADNLFPEDELT
jgi:hypothetical protein